VVGTVSIGGWSIWLGAGMLVWVWGRRPCSTDPLYSVERGWVGGWG
jgi:hypothetical protein